MRVLLDTHVFLWWLYESLRLSARVREVLADGSNTLLFSSASVWALIIKIQSGKLRIPEEPEAFIVGRLALHSMDSLSVKLEHAVRVYTLPPITKTLSTEYWWHRPSQRGYRSLRPTRRLPGIRLRSYGEPGYLIHPREQAAAAFAEDFRLRQQAEHQEGFGFEIEEEAWLYQDVVFLQQFERPFFLAADARHLQRGVPAAFDRQHAAGRFGGDRRFEPRQVCAHSRGDLRLNAFAQFQKARRGLLHGGAYGKIRVRDPLQLVFCFGARGRGSGDDDPAELHLGQARDFGKPGHGKGQPFRDAGQGAHPVRVFREGVIGEDFI